jgi:hypothetical protein
MKKRLQFIDDFEKQAEAQLMEEFRSEVGLFEQAIDILTNSVARIGLDLNAHQSVSWEEILASGNAKLICTAVTSDLLSEFMFRLWASRRILRSGYVSRAMACLRDALEALKYSDICRNDVKQSTRWMKGRRIRTQGMQVHPEISEAYNLLYQWLSQAGVHAQCVAADTSKVYFVSRERDDIVRLGSMATILAATSAFTDYFLGAYDDFLRRERGLREELRRVSALLSKRIRKLGKACVRVGVQPKVAWPKND